MDIVKILHYLMLLPPHHQVAHFYNTIDKQMIPSQQAMMLEAAMAFEHIIKNPRTGLRNTNSEVGKGGERLRY